MKLHCLPIMNIALGFTEVSIYYDVDKALGTTEQDGAGSDSYIAAKVLAEETWVEEVSRAVPTPSLPISGKYLALGWADYFDEDENVLLPLLVKYNFQNTFYWQPKPVTDNYLTSLYTTRDPKNIEKAGSYSGYHLYLHWTYGQLCPLYDGRTTPTNDELRVDRGDGNNEWGHPITDTLETSLGALFCNTYLLLNSTVYNKQWQNLSDAECQLIRAPISMFMTPYDNQNYQKVLEGLDYLSNYFLGTSGTSVYNDDYDTRSPGTVDGSEPSEENKILGGILTGATSTANHEFWERVIEISWRWKRAVHDISRKDTFWATSGGISYGILYYPYGEDRADLGSCYVDQAQTQIVDGEAKFYSAISDTTRSFNDVLRDGEYKNTMGAQGEGVRMTGTTGMRRLEAQRIYKKNQHESRTDLIGDGYRHSLRIFDTKALTAEINSIMAGSDVIKDCYDLTATDAKWSGASGDGTGKFDDFINLISKYQAWGLIAEGVGDSIVATPELRASMAMFIEAVFQYCKKADITVISHEQALDLALTETLTPSNYFPNPDFNTTPKTIIGSENAPDYPDGWNGGVVIEETVDGETESVLDIIVTAESLTEFYWTRQYAVVPGNLSLSVWAKGRGTLNVKLIRNDDVYNDESGDAFEDWITIPINNLVWEEFTDEDTIPDAPIKEYSEPADAAEKTTQYYFKGLDDKVCGIHIELNVGVGNELKISKPVIDIGIL